MNIHEHQAKEILKEFGAPVTNGVVILEKEEIEKKIQNLRSDKVVLKAQIHAGGRGKAGGVKLLNKSDCKNEIIKMFGKVLVTHQTGPEGKKVKRIYIQEAYDIEQEFYLSCLIDRQSSKIAFISSTEGGVDIESVAQSNPKKIKTTKISLKKSLDEKDILDITKIFNLDEDQKKDATKLVNALYNILIQKDASLIEINPLVLTKQKNLVCLDAKMNFDDNALFRRPEILKLRDLNEEEPAETKASIHDLAYIKLNGSIGCMVNGAGLAMATMDIIKLYGEEPANFLDVGGGATKDQVMSAFKIILSDKNVKGILVNIFGGIMRCEIIAQGIIETVNELNLSIPLVVRLEGTNVELGKKYLKESGLNIIPANDLDEAAKKVVDAVSKG